MVILFHTLFWLLVGHFLCDYPLQGDFLAKLKNPESELGKQGLWIHGMVAHAMIHAGAVALVTGNIWLGGAEFVVHFATDWMKCVGWLSYKVDQWVHIVSKVMWALVVVAGIQPPP